MDGLGTRLWDVDGAEEEEKAHVVVVMISTIHDTKESSRQAFHFARCECRRTR